MTSATVQSRLRNLRDRLRADNILRDEMADFLKQPMGAWQDEDGEAMCTIGDRWCRVAKDQVTLGNSKWPGSKRIPLA